MFALILKIAPWLMRAAPLLGMVKGKAKLIGAAISILSLLGTYWYINALQNDISELEGQAILITAQLEQCQTVNGENMGTILELRNANSSLAMAIEVSAEVRDSAAANAKRRDKLAIQAILRTKQELEDLRNESPTCKEFSKIDMGAACPIILDRLRQSATDANRQD